MVQHRPRRTPFVQQFIYLFSTLFQRPSFQSQYSVTSRVLIRREQEEHSTRFQAPHPSAISVNSSLDEMAGTDCQAACGSIYYAVTVAGKSFNRPIHRLQSTRVSRGRWKGHPRMSQDSTGVRVLRTCSPSPPQHRMTGQSSCCLVMS